MKFANETHEIILPEGAVPVFGTADKSNGSPYFMQSYIKVNYNAFDKRGCL